MKKIMLIFVLTFIPLLFLHSQDKKEKSPLTIIQKEIVCPDCQGFGWIYCPNSTMPQIRKNSTLAIYGGNSDSYQSNAGSRPLKMICPYCGVRKTVFIEYEVQK